MNRAIVIGDSTNNTLSAVRSLGEAGIGFTLILVCDDDTRHVRHSRYVSRNNFFWVRNIDDCKAVLARLSSTSGQKLFTTFDAAAEWVDANEHELSRFFITPCRGKQLGDLFNKAEQCKLAAECGFDVPKSTRYNRNRKLPANGLSFPIITKPLVSSRGSKSDIHVCYNIEELQKSLDQDSTCDDFIIQEYVEKEFEINCLCMRNEKGTCIGTCIQKIRHWPMITGAASFGVTTQPKDFGMNENALDEFLDRCGYHGPFSVEFLHKGKHNYFLEVNFRNDGLAYTSTMAGVNLHCMYVNDSNPIGNPNPDKIFMMDYSIDLLHVKAKSLSFFRWARDFISTRCLVNACLSDPMPTVMYYLNKIKKT